MALARFYVAALLCGTSLCCFSCASTEFSAKNAEIRKIYVNVEHPRRFSVVDAVMNDREEMLGAFFVPMGVALVPAYHAREDKRTARPFNALLPDIDKDEVFKQEAMETFQKHKVAVLSGAPSTEEDAAVAHVYIRRLGLRRINQDSALLSPFAEVSAVTTKPGVSAPVRVSRHVMTISADQRPAAEYRADVGMLDRKMRDVLKKAARKMSYHILYP